MASWSVVRETQGSPQILYYGRLRDRANDTFERAKPEAGELIEVHEHSDGGRRVVKTKAVTLTWVIALCKKCRRTQDVLREACVVHGSPICCGQPTDLVSDLRVSA